MSGNRRNKVMAVIGLLVIDTILLSIALGNIAVVKRENRVKNAYIAGQSIANAIQLTLDNTLSATESLKYFYLLDEEHCISEFDSISESIVKDNPLISGVYLAPKGVIEMVYPETNSAAIGFDMLEDPEQGPRAQLAVNTREITVAGPHELIEGGVGFIIRNPVFVDNEFKGFTIIVLDWDAFVEQVMQNLSTASVNYDFAVWKEDLDETAVTDADGYIFRNTQGSIDTKVDIAFEVPNDVWHLNVRPKEGWLVVGEMIPSIVISVLISLSLIFFLLFYFWVKERERILQRDREANEIRMQYMDRLSEAMDKARAADDAKRSFLARMSHDIRTPLNGIIGLMEINERHADDRTLVDENRRKAKVAANHLQSLLSDVLELTKLEDDSVQLAKEPFSILSMASDVFTIINLKAAEAGITLYVSEDSEKLEYPYVYGSPLHLRQVLINLFGNAIKYNKPEGSIACRIRNISHTDTIVTYSLEISDTGIGMSPEFMEHLFEPFSQEHHDAGSTYQGTGLGMAIVKTLVDKMNGTIEVTSEVNVGSTFTITIPFEIADASQIRKETMIDQHTLQGVHILLAEDNELNMEIAEMLLADYGAAIHRAWNGQEAVITFSKYPPGTFDVILMDVMMPVMDGYTAAQTIRACTHADAKSIPIIAMTAHTFAEDIQKCYDAGMTGHAAKPLDIQKLVGMIASSLKTE